MCLITEQKEPLIAKKNMKVYKILGENLTGRHYVYFQYEVGKLNQTEIQDSEEWFCFDEKDSNYLDKKYGSGWNPAKLKELKCIGQGFHAALTKKRLTKNKSSFEKLFTCTIPKGSQYFLDATGLVVSNQIIINNSL